MNKPIYWHDPVGKNLGYVMHEKQFPEDGRCERISESTYYRLKLHYLRVNEITKTKKPLKRELVKDRDVNAYLGRAALFKLRNDEIQGVIDQLSLCFSEPVTVVRDKVLNAALVPQRVLTFEDEL
jgi:hypothetical protein